MPNRPDPVRIRGRVHALTRIAAVLALLVVSVEEAGHSHEGEAGPAAECSACLLGKTPGHTVRSHTPVLTGPSLVTAPTTARNRDWPPRPSFSLLTGAALPPSASLCSEKFPRPTSGQPKTCPRLRR